MARSDKGVFFRLFGCIRPRDIAYWGPSQGGPAPASAPVGAGLPTGASGFPSKSAGSVASPQLLSTKSATARWAWVFPVDDIPLEVRKR